MTCPRYGLNELLPVMKNALSITIQNTIAMLGFMPDDCGDGVKAVLAGTDDVAIVALGCYLEECQKQGNYEPLRRGLKDIADALKEER